MRLAFVGLCIWFATGVLLAPHAAAIEPPPGSPLRVAVLDALRPRVERDLGQPVRFNIARMTVEEAFAFVSATPRTRDEKPIDWSRTRFAREFAQGFMSDAILALLRNGKNGWEVVEYALGPTDVPWEDWVAKYQLPRHLFDPSAPKAEASPGTATNIDHAQWQTLHLGALTLELPSSWQPILPPAPLDLHAEQWSGATFAEIPREVERGASLDLAWGKTAAGYTRHVEDDDILGAEEVDLFGQQTGRVDFEFRNAKTATRGFDVILEDTASTKTFVLTCRAPPEAWPRVAETCRQVVANARMNWSAASAPSPDASDIANDTAKPAPIEDAPSPQPEMATSQASPVPKDTNPSEHSPVPTPVGTPANQHAQPQSQPPPSSSAPEGVGWSGLPMLVGGLVALLGIGLGWLLGRRSLGSTAQTAAHSTETGKVRGRVRLALWALVACVAIGVLSLLSAQPLVTLFRLIWLAGLALMFVSALVMVLTFRNAREITPLLLTSGLGTCLAATVASLLFMPTRPSFEIALISVASGSLVGAASAYSALLYLDGEHVRMRGTAWSLAIWSLTLALHQVLGLVVGLPAAMTFVVPLLGAGISLGNTLGLLLRLRQAARLVPDALVATRPSLGLRTS